MQLFLENLIEVSIKIVPLVTASLVGFLFGVLKDSKNIIFNRKLAIYSEIISKINKHEYAITDFDETELIDLFAPARLLGSRKLELYLREYYSLVIEYKNIDINSLKEEKSDEISEVVMNIEQVMREELGNRRILSGKDILRHVYN
jgi:hypothetical protein